MILKSLSNRKVNSVKNGFNDIRIQIIGRLTPPLLSKHIFQEQSRISPSSREERDELSLSEPSLESLASEGTKTDRQLVTADLFISYLFTHVLMAQECLRKIKVLKDYILLSSTRY